MHVCLILTYKYGGTGYVAKLYSLSSSHFSLANNLTALIRVQKDAYSNNYRFYFFPQYMKFSLQNFTPQDLELEACIHP